MGGAASHVDLFDFKPELIKRHGEKWDPGETVELFQSSPGNTYKSPWEWSNYGQCGKPLTSIVSELGECVDDMAFVHNVWTNTCRAGARLVRYVAQILRTPVLTTICVPCVNRQKTIGKWTSTVFSGVTCRDTLWSCTTG